MSWFDRPDYWKVDPDGRQDKSSSTCSTRAMTPEERERYGPKSDKPKRGFLLTDSDLRRSLEHRKLRQNQKERSKC